jgi:hypothetical protein
MDYIVVSTGAKSFKNVFMESMPQCFAYKGKFIQEEDYKRPFCIQYVKQRLKQYGMYSGNVVNLWGFGKSVIRRYTSCL